MIVNALLFGSQYSKPGSETSTFVQTMQLIWWATV